MEKTKKRFIGPKGYSIIADRSEVFPEDPGNGTPLMVYSCFYRNSATFNCAIEEGVLMDRDGTEREIPLRVKRWLGEIEETICEFVYGKKES